MTDYDIIVVGGGHAGCEAAYAASRLGLRTLLLAIDPANIGAMSCNPAVGGVGKGHLVREVDAFAGLIGQAADAATVHRRMLNRSKGPAVHGPRVQADRRLFADAIMTMLRAQSGLSIARGEVVSLSPQSGACPFELTAADGERYRGAAVILCTGTFLGGQIFRGTERVDGGRMGEKAAHPMAGVIADLGLRTRRLKTGTPPRLDARQIDWSLVARQGSDRDQWRMSAWSKRSAQPGLFCGVTRTNAATHEVIGAAAACSPLASGAIVGTGPRYCPSIEDKVRRFGDRDGHQIFLEPETLDGRIIYPNGISTSLDTKTQERFVRTIPGLSQCDIIQPGYAVEYVAVDARHCGADLMVTSVPGLFLAGQINGTTGYEEAAAQGLVAGLSAASFVREREPLRFDRRDSYIGVLIDDLTLQEITEPYRMLTARSENRLWLRADNAERRLGSLAMASGVLSERQVHEMTDRRMRVDEYAFQAARGLDLAAVDDALAREAVTDLLYAPYIDRARRVEGRQDRLDRPLSVIDFRGVRGLSSEMIERLERARPSTIAAASRVAGVTPAAVTALMAASNRA